MSLVSSRSANTRDSSKHHFFLLHSLFLNLPFLLLLYIYIASVLCIPINNNKENLEHRSTVDGVQGDKVVAKRIGDVLTPVRRWPFASRRTLDEDTQHGATGRTRCQVHTGTLQCTHLWPFSGKFVYGYLPSQLRLLRLYQMGYLRGIEAFKDLAGAL